MLQHQVNVFHLLNAIARRVGVNIDHTAQLPGVEPDRLPDSITSSNFRHASSTAYDSHFACSGSDA